jgi:rubrerythrin
MTPANAIEKLETNGGYHFVCRECGYDIYSFGAEPKEPVCATCQWIVEFGASLTEAEKRNIRWRTS